MYRPYLLLLLGINCVLATPIYDDKESSLLNISASCPESYCSLWELQSDFQQPLRYSSHQVPQLEQLELNNCRMRALPVELLRLTPNLQRLQVQNSSIYHVNKEDFEAITQLKQLALRSNHIGRLREQQFVSLSQLQLLQLDHNNIQIVRSQVFEGLSQLQLLGLQGNGITQLAEDALEPLTQLIHLDLSDNEIEQLNARTFGKNSKLQTLLLNGNPLAHFESNCLAGLGQLRLLDLSNCGEQLEELQLHSVHQLLLQGSSLRRLIIDGSVINLQASNNALTQLSIADKSAVIELNLQGNQLSGNASVALLKSMWNLQQLDLSNNQIESMIGLSMLPSLSHLNLAHNKLSSLPPLDMRLQQLNISFNAMLQVSTADFAALPSLQRLYMLGNRLENFDYELLHHQHARLKELAICDKKQSFRTWQKMSIYLADHGVQLTESCLHHPLSKSLPPAETPATEQALIQAGVAGIHPYWTTRDILAFLTLLVVFIILLMQLYRILEEEGWLRRMRLWCNSRQPAVVNGTRPRPLNEEDSESSSE